MLVDAARKNFPGLRRQDRPVKIENDPGFISRSVIVNIDHIQELQPMFKGENLVVLKSGKSYPTTRPIREIQQILEFR